jgi:hypothetical protein
MLGTPAPMRVANGAVDRGRIRRSYLSVAGFVAAGIWAVGLVVGVLALVTGHAGVAVVALILAVAAPWAGLAWVSHGQRRTYNVALYLHGPRAAGSASLAGSAPAAEARAGC